jgi:uncharacterized lipoprotein NlpE involved in copper resistance
MKLLQIICLSLFITLAMGCKEEKKPEGQQDRETVPEAVTDTVAKETVVVDPLHNSSNSLDWAGTYSGVTPCADCPGMKTVMILNNDNTYSLSEQYLEKEKTPRTFKGKFYWDEAGSIITLDAEGDHHKFKVMEGRLQLLDKFGDAKQGGRAEEFILPKVK